MDSLQILKLSYAIVHISSSLHALRLEGGRIGTLQLIVKESIVSTESHLGKHRK